MAILGWVGLTKTGFMPNYFGFDLLRPNNLKTTNIDAPVSFKIETMQSNLDHKVSVDDLTTVKNLFIKNNIDINNFQITYFAVEKPITNNPDARYYTVKANRIYNKLPIFLGGDAIYHFNKDGIKVFQTGNTFNIDVNISQTPEISKEDAATILLKKYPDEFAKDNLLAELGITNKKVGMGYDDPDFVLSWKITVGNFEFSYAVVNAINGEIIYFDDGMRY